MSFARQAKRNMPLFKQLSLAQTMGLSLLLVLVVYALGASFVMSGDGMTQDLRYTLQAPSADFWLGTDHFGRNMWLRLADALQRSLLLAVLCVMTSACLGCLLGLLAAAGPTWLDRLLDIGVNIILALPGLVLVLILAAIVPGSFWMLYVAISLIQWIEYFRVTRAIVQRQIHSPEVQASRLMGFGYAYLFVRHLWPKLKPQLLTLASFGAANAVLMMASLGFVYVGIQPPLAELGLMAVELFPLYSEAPWLLLQPVVALALLVLSCHLLGREQR